MDEDTKDTGPKDKESVEKKFSGVEISGLFNKQWSA